jgi:hypothetical protein
VIASQVAEEFEPNHQLVELTSSWVRLMAGAASFDERLKVTALLMLFVLI